MLGVEAGQCSPPLSKPPFPDGEFLDENNIGNFMTLLRDFQRDAFLSVTARTPLRTRAALRASCRDWRAALPGFERKYHCHARRAHRDQMHSTDLAKLLPDAHRLDIDVDGLASLTEHPTNLAFLARLKELVLHLHPTELGPAPVPSLPSLLAKCPALARLLLVFSDPSFAILDHCTLVFQEAEPGVGLTHLDRIHMLHPCLFPVPHPAAQPPLHHPEPLMPLAPLEPPPRPTPPAPLLAQLHTILTHHHFDGPNRVFNRYTHAPLFPLEIPARLMGHALSQHLLPAAPLRHLHLLLVSSALDAPVLPPAAPAALATLTSLVLALPPSGRHIVGLQGPPWPPPPGPSSAVDPPSWILWAAQCTRLRSITITSTTHHLIAIPPAWSNLVNLTRLHLRSDITQAATLAALPALASLAAASLDPPSGLHPEPYAALTSLRLTHLVPCRNPFHFPNRTVACPTTPDCLAPRLRTLTIGFLDSPLTPHLSHLTRLSSLDIGHLQRAKTSSIPIASSSSAATAQLAGGPSSASPHSASSGPTGSSGSFGPSMLFDEQFFAADPHYSPFAADSPGTPPHDGFLNPHPHPPAHAPTPAQPPPDPYQGQPPPAALAFLAALTQLQHVSLGCAPAQGTPPFIALTPATAPILAALPLLSTAVLSFCPLPPPPPLPHPAAPPACFHALHSLTLRPVTPAFVPRAPPHLLTPLALFAPPRAPFPHATSCHALNGSRTARHDGLAALHLPPLTAPNLTRLCVTATPFVARPLLPYPDPAPEELTHPVSYATLAPILATSPRLLDHPRHVALAPAAPLHPAAPPAACNALRFNFAFPAGPVLNSAIADYNTLLSDHRHQNRFQAFSPEAAFALPLLAPLLPLAPHLHTLDLRHAFPFFLNPRPLDHIPAAFPHLLHLRVPAAHPPLLAKLADHTPALRTLHALCCRHLTDDDLTPLPTALPLLTALLLHRCFRISDAGAAPLATHPALRSLALTDSPSLTPAAAATLATAPRITCLHLSSPALNQPAALGAVAAAAAGAAPGPETAAAARNLAGWVRLGMPGALASPYHSFPSQRSDPGAGQAPGGGSWCGECGDVEEGVRDAVRCGRPLGPEPDCDSVVYGYREQAAALLGAMPAEAEAAVHLL